MENPKKTKEGLEVEESASGQLRQEESKKEGAVAFHVYRAYWRAVGWGMALAILFSLLLMQGRSHLCRPSFPYQPCCLGPCHSPHLVLIVTKPRGSPGVGSSWDQRHIPNSESPGDWRGAGRVGSVAIF